MASVLSLLFDESANLSGEAFLKRRAPISGLIAENSFGFQQKISGQHVYMETGAGQPIIFCHGLFGSFRNFANIGQALSHRYRVIVPCLPMYDAPLNKCTVEELANYLELFINDLGLKNVILAGNSMGGGTVLTYAINNPQNVDKLMLFASSGLSFIPMRGGAMKLKDFNYVKSLLSDIFYGSPDLNDNEVREIFNVMQNKPMLLRCLSFTRSTKRNFLHEKIQKLQHKTLVVWGNQDTVTPPFIAQEFKDNMQNATVHYLDECGHVPPYEKPSECLALVEEFLKT